MHLASVVASIADCFKHGSLQAPSCTRIPFVRAPHKNKNNNDT
jgi:hypothetical protein